MKRSALVCGAGGFIGHHLVQRLKAEGAYVRGVDLKAPDFSRSAADEFLYLDLRDAAQAQAAIDVPFDEVYQLAADMGGAGYLFSGENDAAVMHNSALINLNVLEAARRTRPDRLFFASSACVYPRANQTGPQQFTCAENTVYPADPDSDYGWEKLFAERLYMAFARNTGITCRIARYHNVFGPEGTWQGGREKAPAALCRKVATAQDGGSIEIWGSGEQVRSFLYVDECVEGTLRLMRSDIEQPLNLGSACGISINALAELIADIAGKRLQLLHRAGPVGVHYRRSDNTQIRALLGWAPGESLRPGLEKTYAWIAGQMDQADGPR